MKIILKILKKLRKSRKTPKKAYTAFTSNFEVQEKINNGKKLTIGENLKQCLNCGNSN